MALSKTQLLFFRLTVVTWILLAAVLVYLGLVTPAAHSQAANPTEPAPIASKPLPKLQTKTTRADETGVVKPSDTDHSYSDRVDQAKLVKRQKQHTVGRDADGHATSEEHPEYSSEKPSVSLYERRMAWKDFVKLPAPQYHPQLQMQLPEGVKSLRQCPASVVEKIQQRLSKEDFDWCKWALSDSGGRVKVGKSYGSLSAPQRDKYEQLNCNAVAQGENPACDDAWGDNQIRSWKRNLVSESCGATDQYDSRVTCRESRSKAKVCVYDNALLDFDKLMNVKRAGRSDSRKWRPGFISSHCNPAVGNNLNYYPALISPTITSESRNSLQCDYVINGTVLIYGHDDPHNLGHSMSDFMNVWSILWLAGLGTRGKEIIFLNTDAIRQGHNYYDDLKELGTHYQKQFQGLLKAQDFYIRDKPKVCVQRLLVQPDPVLLFTWDGWWQDMKCSFVGPSSLFQRWNVQVRHLYDLLPATTAPQASDNKVRVLLINRVVRSQGAAPMYTSRVISNIDEISRGLQQAFGTWSRQLSSENVEFELVVQDLAVMSFEAQVRLVASVDVVIGVHGAGIPNAMHMAIGARPHCCAVLEIFPQGEFTPIRGYGNMVRRMGMHYDRLDLDSRSSGSHGAKLAVPQLVERSWQLVQKAVKEPSCVLPSVVDDPFFDSIPA